MFATSRTIKAAVFAAAAAAVALTTAGTAVGETVTVHARGTGQEMSQQIMTHGADGVRVENPYPAQIFPIPGQVVPYNNSVEAGNTFGVDIMSRLVKPGDTANYEGYSQGAVVAGDSAEQFYLRGLKNGHAMVMYKTESDPRLRGTGIEVVFQEFTDGLPQFGYPFVQFRGERVTQGRIRSVNYCDRYDLICNGNSIKANPGGVLASALGYATGHHDYRDADGHVSRVLTYDNGYTVVVEIDKGNPLVKIGDQASKVLTGEPMTDAQQHLVEALSPTDAPGSRIHVTPDVEEVSAAAGEVAEEGYAKYAPQVVNKAVDAGVTQATGNPVVGNIAGDVAQKVAEPIVAATAPIVRDGVAAATESLMTGNPSAINNFASGLVPPQLVPAHR